MTDDPELKETTTPAPGRTWRDVLRPAVHRIRRLAYRLAYPWHRRQALEMVEKAAPVQSVSFICLGNICRSPYAAAVASRELEERGVRVTSAGLLRGGRPCPGEAVETARERGLDLQSHTSRRFEPGVLADVDLVVVMDPRQKRALVQHHKVGRRRIVVLGDLDPSTAGGRRAITDPYGQDLPVFREVYDRIDRCISVLLEAHSRGTRGISSSKKNRVP